METVREAELSSFNNRNDFASIIDERSITYLGRYLASEMFVLFVKIRGNSGCELFETVFSKHGIRSFTKIRGAVDYCKTETGKLIDFDFPRREMLCLDSKTEAGKLPPSLSPHFQRLAAIILKRAFIYHSSI